jgi:archaellum component FlaC|tara:strand:- start:321 stop:620 length:300 start_codon:yes stop_codon:yes gene_type:complete
MADTRKRKSGMSINKTVDSLKEFINEKFDNHEELEALRFKRIDELITSFGKEIDSNEETIKRVHTRVDRIETRIKTVQGMGTAVATALGAVAAWLGMSK